MLSSCELAFVPGKSESTRILDVSTEDLVMQLSAVYFFEYVISAGAASKVLPVDEDCTALKQEECGEPLHCSWHASDNGQCLSTIFIRRNAYAIFAFCYQVTVCARVLSYNSAVVLLFVH